MIAFKSNRQYIPKPEGSSALPITTHLGSQTHKSNAGRASAANYLFFFFSPVLAMIAAVSDFRNSQAKNLVWLFCAYYGIAFYFNSDLGVDSVAYANTLREMHLTATSFELLTSTFYQKGGGYFDIFQPLLTFIVSRFTDDHRILFGLVGFCQGFFFSRFLWYFIDRLSPPLVRIELYYILLLAFSLDIGTAINGVRMWTAMFIYLFGAVEFLDRRKIVHLLVLCASIFVHFSFTLPVILFLLFLLVYRFPQLIYLFFVCSFVFTFVELSFFRDLLSNLPGIEERTASYLRDKKNAGQELTWAIDANRRMIHFWFLAVMSFCSFYFIIPSCRSFRLLGLLSMLVYGTVNVMHEVGSIFRFYYVAELLAFGYILLESNAQRMRRPDFKLFHILLSPLLAMELALGVRFFLGFASLGLILGNPFTIWFIDTSTSLYDLLPWRW
jgi:hypothetical protein